MWSGRISVLLSDDSTIVREGVQALLAREPDIDVVGVAADYDELIEECRADDARWVLVTDIGMPPRSPGERGSRRRKRFARRRPDTGVVILSQYHRMPEYALALLRVGADRDAPTCSNTGSASGDQLARAIREVAAGGSVLDPEIVQALVE